MMNDIYELLIKMERYYDIRNNYSFKEKPFNIKRFVDLYNRTCMLLDLNDKEISDVALNVYI